MAIELNRTNRASAAAEFLADLSAARPAQHISFQAQLAGAIGHASILPPPVGRLEASGASRQDGARQILDAPLAATAAALSLPANAAAAPQQAPAGNPVETLKEALRQAGMDPSGFSFTEIRELVGYPGGAYVNHQVLFQAGAAREYYDVALMLRSPQVTVTEIRRLLTFNAAPVQT